MRTEKVSLSWPEFLKLLAHDIRWEILALLARSDYRVQELVRTLKQPQNLISYHLRQLANHHLVTERRSSADARDIYYTLNLEILRKHYFEAASALHPALSILETSEEKRSQESPASQARVLFLCTKNSARSQMAEGLLRHFSAGTIDVESAGTEPASLHPCAIQVMAAMGIDMSQQRSKHLDLFRDHTFDYIITVCDRIREVCPTFPGDGEQMHWSIPDPAIAGLSEQEYQQRFEDVAQQLVHRIRAFLLLIEHER